MKFMLMTIIIVLTLFLANGAFCELIHGYTNIQLGFDFSTQTVIPDPTDDACDLCMWEIFMVGDRLYSCENNSLITTIYSVTLDEVLEAPENTQLYSCHAIPWIDAVYVIHTSDGFYAKFVLLEPWPNHTIEYYVQLDGSSDLDSTIPVEMSNWGRIKELFK